MQTYMVRARTYPINYVYHHVEENIVVYVGMGTYGRAWDATNSRVTNCNATEHVDWMREQYESNGDAFVRIVKRGLTREEARTFEAEEIGRHKPRFNKSFTGRKFK